MTEQQPNLEHEPQQAVNEPVEPADAPEANEAPDAQAEPQEAAQAREQLAEAKTRGDQFFERLKLATMQQGAGDVVQAISDLPADDPRYYDDAGFPSAEGVRAVALELVQAKPYLARAHGDVGAGVKNEKPQPTWTDVMNQYLG
jgi:hypothetical protein